MQNIINFILDNWESLSGIGLAVITLLARLYPTQKNWDIVGGTIKTLDKIIPNLKKNKDDGSITRFCVVWLLFLLPGFVIAQNNAFTKGVFSYNVSDTAFQQNNRTALQNLYGNTGNFYFDKARNKWRIWAGTCETCTVDSAYVDLLNPGSGGSDLYWKTTGTTTIPSNATISGVNNTLGFSGFNSIALTASGTGSKSFSISNSALGSFVISQALNEFRLTDTRGAGLTKGIQYAADYSSGYNTRSLVDKGYADTNLKGLTFTNSPSSGNAPIFNGTNWTFSTPGGTPAGANTEIQYNNAGAFGASSKLTYVAASDIMTIADATDQSNIISPSGLVINDVSTNSNITLNNNVAANPRITLSKSFQGLYFESDLANTDNIIVSTGEPLKIYAGETSEPGVLVTSTANNALVFAVTTDDGSSMISTREIAGVRDVSINGKINLDKGISTTANDGATINQISGRFRKDNSGAVYTLTNSFIDANSIIILTPANSAIDATATSWTTLAGAGSATITFNAAPTANFDMNFLVMN